MKGEGTSAAMSDFRKLVRQSTHYLSGNTLIMLSGFVSFPILTRVFTVSDYGILNLISSSLVIAVAVCKMGLQNSVTRFYEEFSRDDRAAVLYSTVFWSVLSFSVVVAILSGMVTRWVGSGVVSPTARGLFLLAALLVVIRSSYEILASFLRAEQRTRLLNGIAVGVKYGSLSLSLVIVFWFVRNLYGFWLGVVLCEGALVAALSFVYLRSGRVEWAGSSAPILRSALRYGVPLLAWDIVGSLFVYADRYLVLTARAAPLPPRR